MSAEIESLNADSPVRRSGNRTSPMLYALAVVGVLLALWSHWRFSQLEDRIGRVRAHMMEGRQARDELAARVAALDARNSAAQAALRNELQSLKALPAQVAVLGRGVEELRTRAEAPQRAWARAEALYLLDLAERQLELDRDAGTAAAAMEAADARLAAFKDPATASVRRLLGQDLAALRAVPQPDLAAVQSRLAALERAAPTLPVVGGAATRPSAPTREPDGALERLVHRIGTALSGLVAVRRVDPATALIVTVEERSLRRQHLELLLFAARVAAMQPDRVAYAQSVAAAGDWLARYFDTSAPAVVAARDELATLGRIDVAPALPSIGAAAQELQRVMHGGPGTP
ncbi:MAG: uroporphyrinogen-III C-methyltransferase [Steroidobacteraceae bacterium]